MEALGISSCTGGFGRAVVGSVVALFAGAVSPVSAQSEAPGPPNVVLIVADDLGYGETGMQGNPEIPTPHIDSIARDGVRFTQAYVTAPNCSPSRAGFLTGKIPNRFGYEFNPIGAGNSEPGVGLPRAERTMAEVLRTVGYTCGLVGKWHLGGTAEFHPQRHGFDEFYGFLHEGHFFVPPPWHGVTTFLRRKHLPAGAGADGQFGEPPLVYSTHMGHDEPPYDADNPVVRGSQPVEEEEYLTDAITREAVDFIGRHRDRPFFLYVAYNAVHSPLQGADDYMEKFRHIPDLHRRVFAAMLGNLDDGVGAVLGKLRDEGLDGRTLVVFFSDNGGPTRELTSSNAPLRGGKGAMYEGGIRVPFALRWSGVVPAGQTYDQPVSATDVLPTAAAAAGAEAEVPGDIDGVDLIPYLTGAATGAPHDTLYWRQGNRTALRSGDWKLVRNSWSGGDWELFNLAADPSEADDQAPAEPERLGEMVTQWEILDGQMEEPRFR